MIDHREKGIEDNAEVEDFFASDLVIFNKLTINDWVKLIKLCDRQFYISKSKILTENFRIFFGKMFQKLIKNLDTLLIDESSMIRADMLDAIDLSLKKNRKNKKC